MAGKKGKGIVVWVLMGLLILGLAGFGVTNFGGTVRTVATVGDVEIDVNDYARALEREMRGLTQQLGQPVGMDMLQGFGRDAQIRAALITAAALDHEARRIGVSVGDGEVANQITAAPQFQGLNGAFDRESYAFALRQQGLTEAEFEDRLRAETARTILEGAVVGGLAAPAAQVAALVDWALERRSFTHVELIAVDLAAPVASPTDADLAAFHEENIARYTRPEIRQVSYVWLSPDDLAGSVEIDDTTLRAAYAERIDEFVQPERRIVERLVFADAAAAADAAGRIAAGETDFAAVVDERGLALADIDLGDVTAAELGTAGDAVFATAEPGVVGPVDTPLGAALFRVNAILAAEEVTFDEARDDLAAEVAIDRARRLILDQAGGIEDLLAGGATLEDLVAEAAMTFGTIELAPDTRDGLAAYTAFRDAAFAAAEGDFPELFELEDGGLAALRLDALLAPAPQPLDAVREQVIADWLDRQTQDRLVALAEELMAQLAAGATLESLGLVTTRYNESTRDGFVGGLPRGALDTVFQTEPGAHAVVTGPGVHLLRTDAVTPVEAGDAEAVALSASVAAQVETALADDLFAAYATGLQAAAGITLNAAAIEAVHAQMR